MNNLELKGRRYLAAARCSTNSQRETSLPDQIALIRAAADASGGICAGEIAIDVSGSVLGARKLLDEIIKKKNKTNFDIVIFQDASRLSRGGVRQGNKIEDQLDEHGIKIGFVMDQIADGDMGDVQKAILHFSSQQHAKNISIGTSRGSMSALLAKRSAHCKEPPYGIDRLYVAPHGRPRCIIRNLADGSQVQLNPKTRKIEARYGRNQGQRDRRHFIKQKDDRIELILGDEARVRAVNLMFRKRYIDGWGAQRIAEELAALGIRTSGGGGRWSLTSVRQILENPIYVGMGIANREQAGLHSSRNPIEPRKNELNAETLNRRDSLPRKLRPRTEWVERQEPALMKFLEPQIRRAFLSRLDELLSRLERGHQPRQPRASRPESEYLLTNILTSKQGGHKMSGRTTGRRGRRVRYYCVKRAHTVPVRGDISKRLVAAEMIEKAVLGAVEIFFSGAEGMRPRIESAVRQQFRLREREMKNVGGLQRERQKIADKLDFVIDQLDAIGKEAAKARIAQLQQSLADLDGRIRAAGAPTVAQPKTVEAESDAIMRDFRKLRKTFSTLPRQGLRDVLIALIAKLEIDLETRELIIELRPPKWAQISEESFGMDVPDQLSCMQDSSLGTTRFAATIAAFVCHQPTRQRCWECRRKAA